ncbi:hypothetical protein CVT24_004875 [Panaeolus cyanescens]|uniref:Uncharacterized protein n=1 Tax=Panaeolus cyanescens TaxID=181874 RepID=A0A409V9X8_9AGAR|nr:hypothetical protein CVT24_004875 [Panaeolus cyanescens]
MSPSLSPFPPKLRNSESLACSSSSSTSFSSSSASSSFSALFDRNSRTSSEWSDITPPASPSQSLEGAVKSMHGGQSAMRAHYKSAFSESLPTLLESDEQAEVSYIPTRLAKTNHHSSQIRGAPRKAHPLLRSKRAENARNVDTRTIDKAAHPPQLIITSPDEAVEEWTESLQKRQDEASALQANAVHSVEENVPQDIEESEDSFSIESTIEAWLDRAQLEGVEFPGVESLLDEQFDFPSFLSDPDFSESSSPKPSPPRSHTVFRPILEPVPEDSVASVVVEVDMVKPPTFWVLEPLPSPSLAPVPEEEEELLSPESMYTLLHANDPSETGSLLDADVDFSMPPTPRINPMDLGDSDFSPFALGSPKIRTTQTPSPRTPLSPRNRQDILHLASPLTTSDDSNHMQTVDVPALMRLEIARTLAGSHSFGQFMESASGLGLGLELTSEETQLPAAIFPSSQLELTDSTISPSVVHASNDSGASGGPHSTMPSEAVDESSLVDADVVGLGLGKLAEASLQSSSSVAPEMEDECLAAELNEDQLSTAQDLSPQSEIQALNHLEQRRVYSARYESVLEASAVSGHQRLNSGLDTAGTPPNSASSSAFRPHSDVLPPRSALTIPKGAEQNSSSPSPSQAPGPLIPSQVSYTQIRSSRLPVPRLSPIQEDDSIPETSGVIGLDEGYGFIIVPSHEAGDSPSSPLAEPLLATQHPNGLCYAEQTTPRRDAVGLNVEQQVVLRSSELPQIKARQRGSRGALHPLLFVKPTPAELEYGLPRGPDAQRVTPAPSTSTHLTIYPGMSKIPAPRASHLEVEPRSLPPSFSNQATGCSSSSLPLAKGKAPLRRKASGGSTVHQKSEVEHAPSKNKKPAATKSARTPVERSVPSTSYFSRFGLTRPSFAREYDDPALRMSIPSVLSAKTDPRSPRLEGLKSVKPPHRPRKAALKSGASPSPPARTNSVKSTKSIGGIGKGLPSHLASRLPQPRDATSATSSIPPQSSIAGTLASAASPSALTVEQAESSSARRSTSPPKRFLQIARFAKRQLYAIPEVPTPSPTFSASVGSTPVPQSPKKAGVLHRLLSPKKSPIPLSPAVVSPQTTAVKKSTATQSSRSAIPKPHQHPRFTAPSYSDRQLPASANPPSTTAVSATQDLPAAPNPGHSPLPFIEHADAPRNVGLFKRSTNQASTVGENSRVQLSSPFARKLRCLF